MKSRQEILAIIKGATGTTQYHRFSMIEFFPVITDGVFALAESAGCYWLLDVIGSYQRDERLDKHFQVWKLNVNPDKSAVVQGFNDMDLIITQEIESTDFPLDEIKFFLEGGVLLLPSEH
jgi:hypothetical protein